MLVGGTGKNYICIDKNEHKLPSIVLKQTNHEVKNL